MITQRKVLEEVNKYSSFSTTSLWRYINELLAILENEDLLLIIMNPETPPGIRRRAYEILIKRISR
ncbi:MAG: hypothetical protein GXO43_01300 [Crenarchaeota archaeon]|nr:hypothetical protein [Thermoproteota archaeon]